MNKNVNVFIAVLLCALLCGGVMWLRMASEEKLGWNIQNTYSASPAYSSGASYSDATFVGPSSGGMMSVTSSRRSAHTRVASSYAGTYSSAATQPLTSNLSPLTSSAPAAGSLYTTSSQTFKSFGGGNNAGVSMSGGSLVTTNNYAQNSSAVSISSPIGYTSLSRNMANPQDALANGLSPEAVIASSMAMPTNGQLFGSYYTNDFSSSIDSYNPGSYTGLGYSGINNRQNSGPGHVEDSWLNWLAMFGTSFGTYDESTHSYTYDQYQLRAAYDAFCQAWNETMGKKPTWDEWLAWFMGSEGSGYIWSDGTQDYTYSFLPVGNILPLLVIVLLYITFLSFRFLKTNKE